MTHQRHFGAGAVSQCQRQRDQAVAREMHLLHNLALLEQDLTLQQLNLFQVRLPLGPFFSGQRCQEAVGAGVLVKWRHREAHSAAGALRGTLGENPACPVKGQAIATASLLAQRPRSVSLAKLDAGARRRTAGITSSASSGEPTSTAPITCPSDITSLR